MDNYQYAELKDAIKRISRLEEENARLKQLILNAVHTSGHFHLQSDDENFLYTPISEDE